VKKSEPPSQEEFDALLAWLHPDRDRAGIILYEEIRPKLIKSLEWRRCHAAEELADETITRVSHLVKDIAATYTDNPARYFHGVRRNVYLEWLKDPEATGLDNIVLVAPDPNEDVELIHQYLDKCRESLKDPEDRDLIIKYYAKEKRAKIENRKQIAEQMGITLNNLRMRIFRINAELQKCIVDCLNERGFAEAGNVLVS